MVWQSIVRKKGVTRGIGVKIVQIGQPQIMTLATQNLQQVNWTMSARQKKETALVKNSFLKQMKKE